VKDGTPFDKFLTNNIHEVLKVCAELRPSVDISVVPTRGALAAASATRPSSSRPVGKG
jgi:hypothetical protein